MILKQFESNIFLRVSKTYALLRQFGGGILSPLDGAQKLKPSTVERGFIFEYHLNVRNIHSSECSSTADNSQ